MTPIPADQRTFRFEYDHTATLTEAVMTMTIDPIKSLFSYALPFIGAWATSHQELRLDDPLQAMLIDEGSKICAIEQVKKLKKIAGISRRITVYTSDNYSCSSNGGACSISAPIISIPRGFLTKSTQTIFSPEIRAHRRVITQEDVRRIAAAHNLDYPDDVEQQLQFPETPVVIERRLSPFAIEAPCIKHWKFTADESLFFIAREVANIKLNNPLISVISKIVFLAAIFLVASLTLTPVIGAVMIASAVALHLIAERLIRSKLDVEAIKLLEEFFDDDRDPQGGEVLSAKERAYNAGMTAIEKILKQNTERRNGNALCQLYITPVGNNYLDLTNPLLTARVAHLEDYKASY